MPWDNIAMTFLMLTGMFLMIVVLLQRGRGGGLAGAFGGAGGQSAFGTKAGDVFTKITVVIAVVWVILAGVSGFILRAGQDRYDKAYEKKEPAMTATPGDKVLEDAMPEEGESDESPFGKKDDDKKAPDDPPEGKDKKASEGEKKPDDAPADKKSTTGKDASDKSETKPEDGPKIPEQPARGKSP